MKKKLAFFLNLLLVFTTIIFLGSCRGATAFELNFIVDSEVYYTINTNGNEVIKMPDNPSKDNYEFDGWYWDKDVWRKQFTARSLLDTPLSSNMNVYAHFVDDTYIHDTDISVKGATKKNIDGIGDVFYIKVRNNQLVFKFNDYIEINPNSKWILSSDISGNREITSKTVELLEGDSNLYYIYVTDKNENHETYFVLVHRNKMFDVSFNSNGGSACDSVKVEEGYYLENVPSSTKDGYSFNGWDYDFINNPINENITANALWNAKQYTISFDADGGDVSTDKLEVKYNENFKLPVPTKNGYKFDGWYENDVLYTDGVWKYTQNIALKAKWKIVSYEITYDLNGGINSYLNPKKYNCEDSDIALSSPSKVGYTFTGWTSSMITTPTKEIIISKGSLGNKEFIANWRKNSYEVTLNVNGGEELDSNTITVEFDSDYDFPVPTRTGYSFDGWYYNSSKCDGELWNIANDVELMANWKPNTDTKYVVNYYLENANDDEFVLDKTEELFGSTDSEVTLKNPYKDFDLPINATEKIKADGSLVIDVYLTRKEYTIDYESNGGNNIDSITQKYYSNVNSFTPVKANRTFDGWYYDEELTQKFDDKVPSLGATLYAKWKEEVSPTQLVYIGETSISITGNSFEGTKLVIPDYIGGKKVTEIRQSAFKGLDKITELIIPESIEKIEMYAFQSMSLLEKITTPFVGTSMTSSNFEAVFGSIFGGTAASASTTIKTSSDKSYTYQFSYKGNNYGYYIPDTLKIVNITKQESIPSYAFYNCDLIEEINIPSTVNEIGEYAFYECNSLSKLNGTEVGELNIPENVKVINSYTFFKCSSAINVSLSNSITSIGQSAFSNCSAVESFNGNKNELIIPSSCQSIGASAFSNMSLIKEVEVADSVNFIGSSAFMYFNSLEKITLPFVGYSETETGVNRVFGYIFGYTYTNVQSNTKTSSSQAYTYQINYKSYSYGYYIPDTLKIVNITKQESIPSYAFYNCDLIEEINIPSTVNEIGECAFYECNSLSKLNGTEDGEFNIPKNVNVINNYAFYKCSSVINISLSNVFTSIGQAAFSNCSAVESFNGNKNELIIPSSCQSIGASAFSNMSLIKEVEVADSVNFIGSSAFMYFNSLEKITLPFVGYSETETGVNRVFGYIFGYTYTNVQSNTKTSSSQAYTYQINYKSYSYGYYIPDTLKIVNITKQESIPSYAFYNCDLIEEINIPSTVNEIGEYAFYECNSLSKLNGTKDGEFNIPENVKVINNYAFYKCSSAINLTIGCSTESIRDYAFFGCSLVSKINSAKDYEAIIPDCIKTIGTSSFSGMALITDLTISENVESIGLGAFRNYNSLQRISLPFIGNSMTSTNANAVLGYIFGKSSSNSSVKTSSASGYTYQGITGAYYFIPLTLKTVNITKQESIPSYAFYNCDLIEEINIPSTVNEIGTYAFYECNNLTKLNKNSNYDVSIPIEVTELKTYLFYNCNSITSVSFGNVSTIDPYAFYKCTSLSRLNSLNENEFIVSDSVEKIGNAAFRGIVNIQSITLPFVGTKENTSAGNDRVFGFIFGYTTGSKAGKTSASELTYQGYYSGSSYYNYYIPNTIKEVKVTRQSYIPENAFYNCDCIEKIYLVENIDSVGTTAFTNCDATVQYNITPTRSTTWDGTSVADLYANGSGTQNDPYQIYKTKEFVYFISQIRTGQTYENTYFELTSDINLGGYTIESTGETVFSGHLNGKGHKVYNFILSSTGTYNGLFGNVSGSIVNVEFETSFNYTFNTTSDVYIGLIVGYLSGLVENVYVKGSLTTTSLNTSYVGGLVGYNVGTISNTYSNVNIVAISTNLKCYAGGLVGYNNGLISGSFAYGDVSAKGYAQEYSFASGLVAYETSTAEVRNSFRYENQIVKIFNGVTSSYNELGTSASHETIISYCANNWDNQIWIFSENLPIHRG